MKNLHLLPITTTALLRAAHCSAKVAEPQDKQATHKTIKTWQEAAKHLLELKKLDTLTPSIPSEIRALEDTIANAMTAKFKVLHREGTFVHPQKVFECFDETEDEEPQKLLYGIAIIQPVGEELFVTEVVINPFKENREEIEKMLLERVFIECVDKDLSGVIFKGHFSILSSLKSLPDERGTLITSDAIASYLAMQ